ncbi:MAG: hypothetical protein GY794_16300 [bacterium]|nr:hypothetical protein [bacterium]
MPGLLDGLQDVATRLITDFGGPAVLRTISQTFDPSTGNTTDAFTDQGVIATPPEPYSVGRIDNSVIRTEDLSTLVQGAGLSPKTGDRFIKDGVDYQIVRIRPQSAGTVIAFYELQLRA